MSSETVPSRSISPSDLGVFQERRSIGLFLTVVTIIFEDYLFRFFGFFAICFNVVSSVFRTCKFALQLFLIAVSLRRILPCVDKIRKLASLSHSAPGKHVALGASTFETLDLLPTEIQISILKYLDVQSMLRMSGTSHRWYNMIFQDNTIWQSLLRRDFVTKNLTLNLSTSSGRSSNNVRSLPTSKSPLFHLYRIKYITNLDYSTKEMLIRRSKRFETVSDILDYEAVRSVESILELMLLLVGFVTMPFTVPVHYLQFYLYHRRTNLNLETAAPVQITSLQNVIAELVYQAHVRYSQLSFLQSHRLQSGLLPLYTSYFWFSLQTELCAVLMVCEFVSMLIAQFNMLLIRGVILFHHLDSLRHNVGTSIPALMLSYRIAVNATKVAALASIFASQVIALGFPYIVKFLMTTNDLKIWLLPDSWSLFHASSTDFLPFASDTALLSVISYAFNAVFDPLLIMPVLEILWIIVVYSSAQERTMLFIEANRANESTAMVMIPIWFCIFAVRLLVHVIHISLAAFLSAWIVGASFVSVFQF